MIKLNRPFIVRSIALIICLGWSLEPQLSHAQSISFTDVAAASGIDHINTSGSAIKQYIIETQPAGGGFWDYNNDGILDIYLTN